MRGDTDVQGMQLPRLEEVETTGNKAIGRWRSKSRNVFSTNDGITNLATFYNRIFLLQARVLTGVCAMQIEVGQGKKAIVIFVPVPLLQGFHKIQQRYVERLPDGEKNIDTC